MRRRDRYKSEPERHESEERLGPEQDARTVSHPYPPAGTAATARPSHRLTLATINRRNKRVKGEIAPVPPLEDSRQGTQLDGPLAEGELRTTHPRCFES